MLVDNDDTKEAPLPPTETGPVPVSYESVEPRLFGVAPPLGVFGLACVALTLSVVAFVGGRWVLGLIAVAAGLLLFAFFLQLARRPSAGASAALVQGVGERAGFVRASLGALSRARREVLALKQEVLRLTEARESALRALGEAALRNDKGEIKRLREQIAALEGELGERERAIADAVERARMRVGDERLAIQPTERLELPPRDEPG